MAVASGQRNGKEQLRVCLFVLGHDDEHADGGEERERDGGEGGDCFHCSFPLSRVKMDGSNWDWKITCFSWRPNKESKPSANLTKLFFY